MYFCKYCYNWKQIKTAQCEEFGCNVDRACVHGYTRSHSLVTLRTGFITGQLENNVTFI